MEENSTMNDLVKQVIAVLIAVIVVGVVMMPIIDAIQDRTEIHTVTNSGVPFAIADDGSHTIEMSVDGDNFVVRTDGSAVSTEGLGTLLPGEDIITFTGPFNSYYGAFNLQSGDNSDDAGETRLSKEKGAMAYQLDPNNLKQTINGYTFDPTLYNVMFVIPSVYWYSELDSEGSQTGKLYMASSPDAFVSMGITADKMKDYAHTYTSGGVVGHAPAIAIGVYEAYNDNGVLTSQSGRTPTGNTSLTNFVPLATAGNTDNDYGTYQLWNWYQWTLYKMMGFTVMGNMDSQYMMGEGPTDMTASTVTGLTSSAYEKSANAQSSVSLFLENTWGSVYEWLGDTKVNNYVLSAGNILGGSTSANSVTNVLGETVTLPTSSGLYYATFNPSSEVFGAPVTVGSIGTAGQAINDYLNISSSTNRALLVGGGWYVTSEAGLSFVGADKSWTNTSLMFGSRLAYLITDPQYSAPVGATGDYAYILSYNINGTVSDVQSIEDGVATSYMPDGTTLNSHWDFGKTELNAPTIEDSTSNITIAVGTDALLKLYDSGDAVVYTSASATNLGRVITPISVTINNGTMSYNGGSASVNLYRATEGDYVLATAPVNVLKDTTVYFGDYGYGLSTSDDTIDIGYAGSFNSSALTEDATQLQSAISVLSPSKTPVNVRTTVNSTSDEHTVTISSIAVFTDYTDSDSSTVTYTQMFAPATASWEEYIHVGGMAYVILTYAPILIFLGVIMALMNPMIAGKFGNQ